MGDIDTLIREFYDLQDNQKKLVREHVSSRQKGFFPNDHPATVAVSDKRQELESLIDEKTKETIMNLANIIHNQLNCSSKEGHEEGTGQYSGDGHSFKDSEYKDWIPDKAWVEFAFPEEQREQARTDLLKFYDSKDPAIKRTALSYIAQVFSQVDLKKIFTDKGVTDDELNELAENSKAYEIIKRNKKSFQLNGPSPKDCNWSIGRKFNWSEHRLYTNIGDYLTSKLTNTELKDSYRNFESLPMYVRAAIQKRFKQLDKMALTDLYNFSPLFTIRHSAGTALGYSLRRIRWHEKSLKLRKKYVERQMIKSLGKHDVTKKIFSVNYFRDKDVCMDELTSLATEESIAVLKYIAEGKKQTRKKSFTRSDQQNAIDCLARIGGPEIDSYLANKGKF